MIPSTLPQDLAKAAKAYSQQLEAYQAISASVVLAKREYELAKLELIVSGLEGKNQAEREARLELSLTVESGLLFALEAEQAQVKLSLEQAKLAWDCARYQVRAFEALKEVA